jgi:hypothetical protein
LITVDNLPPIANRPGESFREIINRPISNRPQDAILPHKLTNVIMLNKIVARREETKSL